MSLSTFIVLVLLGPPPPPPPPRSLPPPSTSAGIPPPPLHPVAGLPAPPAALEPSGAPTAPESVAAANAGKEPSRPPPSRGGCPRDIACTDIEIVESLTFDAARACKRDDWERCATLSARALEVDPSAYMASTLLSVANRHGAVASQVRTSPGFLNGLFQLSAGMWIGRLVDKPHQVLAEIHAGGRFGAGSGRGIFQLDGGLVLGSYSPYAVMREARTDTNHDGVIDDQDARGAGALDGEGYLGTRVGAGIGARFTVGFAVRTTKIAALEFVWVPGTRLIGSTTSKMTLYVDFGSGLAYQYGRLRWEALAQVSTATLLSASEFSPAVFGVVLRGSIGLGKGKGSRRGT